MKNFIRLLAAGAVFLLPLGLTGAQGIQEISREKILAAGPEWQQNYDKFQPIADMVETLKPKIGASEKIDVYLGLWCPDSRRNLPLFLKFLDQLGTGVPVRYFDVPRKASREIQYYVPEMKVERVPTFIFYRDGKEIGRIVENPKTGMVEDIFDIVYK